MNGSQEPERRTEAAVRLRVLLAEEHSIGYKAGYQQSAMEGMELSLQFRKAEFKIEELKEELERCRGSDNYSWENRALAAEDRAKRLREKIASIEELLRIPDNK